MQTGESLGAIRNQLLGSVDLGGRVAIITGGSRGLGAATAVHLAGCGHRVIGTVRSTTKAAKLLKISRTALYEKLKRMETAKIAPLAVYLASDGAADVTGQIFGVRANEIYLFSQNRPLRSVQRSEGWTPETIANHAMPALKAHFYSLDRSQDVFTWDPV